MSDIEASRNGAKKNQSRGAHQLFAEAVGNTSRSRNGNDTTVKPNNRPKAIQGTYRVQVTHTSALQSASFKTTYLTLRDPYSGALYEL